MRIEPKPTRHGGMACGTVALRMTGRTRLETLARGLTVPQAEAAESIVIARLADPRRRNEARLLVTALTKLRGIVAIAAIRLTRVRRARVACEERRGVIA
jgi:hypothetical protein